MGPNVSHTNVKEAKERHLGSKALKSELEALASRRLNRLKIASLDRVRDLFRVWVERKCKLSTCFEKDLMSLTVFISPYHILFKPDEQLTARSEIESLDDAIKEVEQAVSINDDIIKADGGAHLFALSGKAGQVSSNSTAFSLLGDTVNTKKK